LPKPIIDTKPSIVETKSAVESSNKPVPEVKEKQSPEKKAIPKEVIETPSKEAADDNSDLLKEEDYKLVMHFAKDPSDFEKVLTSLIKHNI
jgi:hypothetical protein